MRNLLVLCVVSVLVIGISGMTDVQADPDGLVIPSTYTGNEDVSGWVMSEKLDGIRGYWNGSHLLSRSGKKLNPPAWFTKSLPPFPLDGELWRSRNDFSFVQKTVLDKTPSASWREISYNIFEVPKAPGNFFQRINKAEKWFKSHPAPHVTIIKQTVCKGPDQLDQFMDKIVSLGGEGVVIKDPSKPYHTGKSPYVLKLKQPSFMEAEVTGYMAGKGKYKGMMGSLILSTPSGIIFKLGTGFTDDDRKNPPPVGSTVIFRHHGYTSSGIPRFASFIRVKTGE